MIENSVRHVLKKYNSPAGGRRNGTSISVLGKVKTEVRWKSGFVCAC